MWCSLVGSVVAFLQPLSSTRAITTDVKGVTELFEARHTAFCGFLKTPLHHDDEHASASITGEADTSSVKA